MRIENVGIALEQVRQNLFAFAVENNVFGNPSPNIRDYFICPNPNHKDNNPSCRILDNGVKGFCFGCRKTFDLLTLNHWVTGAPISGSGFVINNLVPLCAKYNVSFELGDLTEEDRFKIDSYNACRIASDYIVNQPWSDEMATYVRGRGISLEFCHKYGIGVVPDFGAFESYMKSFYSTVFLRDGSFLRPGLFGPNNVIFTIKDESGSAVGFVARDLKYEEKYQAWSERGKVGAPPRKYDSTGETNRIYYKRNILFGLSDFLDTEENRERLYLVEGQFDWAILKESGLTNVSCLGGKYLTPAHLALLRKSRVQDLVLVLDGDNAGREGTRELLLGSKNKPGMLSTASTVNVYVVELPEDHDPNSFVREFGIEAFNALPLIDSFSWALNNMEHIEDPLKVCEVMIPFILVEANVIRRDQMMEALSQHIGISKELISGEVCRRENLKALEIESEIQALAEEAIREIQYNGGKPMAVFEQALVKMHDLDTSISEDPLSIDETVTALELQMDKEEALEGPAGFRFSSLKNLELALNGKCEGMVIAIGGIPSVGKTGQMSQISKELTDANDDTVVILHTIDDDRSQMVNRLVVQYAVEEAYRIGSPLAQGLALNKISNPKYYLERDPDGHEGLMELRAFGYEKLKRLLKDGRLHIKDTTHGATISFLDKMVKKARYDFKDARLVVILDNFHKAQDFSTADERVATKRKSSMLKTGIAQKYGATIFSTFEYRKVETGKRPRNDDLRETVNIEYDINYLEHLYSPLKAAMDTGREESCFMYHGPPHQKMPIVEGDIGKNKITEVKTRHFYKFFPHQSRYEAITYEEAMAIEDGNRISKAREDGSVVAWKGGKKIEIPELMLTGPGLSSMELPF